VTIYARCVAFVGRSDDMTVGAYTIGKEYEVLEERDNYLGLQFDIYDDEDDCTLCWWDGDPDCVWERIER